MTSRRTVTALTTLGLAAVLAVAGCGGDDGGVTVDPGNDTVKVETSDGTAVVTGGDDGTLPEGWPEEVALPEGGNVTGGVAVTTPGQEGWTAALEYPDTSAEDVAAALTSSLESAGFTSEGTVTTAEGSMLVFKSSTYAVTAIVSAEGSGSTAAITVGREG